MTVVLVTLSALTLTMAVATYLHLSHLGVKLMAASAAVLAFAARVDTATNEIAADIQVLKDKVAAGGAMTAEDQAELDRIADRLEKMGKDPDVEL